MIFLLSKIVTNVIFKKVLINNLSHNSYISYSIRYHNRLATTPPIFYYSLTNFHQTKIALIVESITTGGI